MIVPQRMQYFPLGGGGIAGVAAAIVPGASGYAPGPAEAGGGGIGTPGRAGAAATGASRGGGGGGRLVSTCGRV